MVVNIIYRRILKQTFIYYILKIYLIHFYITFENKIKSEQCYIPLDRSLFDNASHNECMTGYALNTQHEFISEQETHGPYWSPV